MLSNDRERIALLFFITGLFMTAFLLVRSLLLPAAVQAISSSIGAMALLVFGGEASEK